MFFIPNGDTYFSPGLAEPTLGDYRQDNTTPKVLRPRERDLRTWTQHLRRWINRLPRPGVGFTALRQPRA